MLNTPLPADSILLHDAGTDRWLFFEHPCGILQTARPEKVMGLLRAVEEAVETRGFHAAGFVAYEAAPGFDPAFAVRPAAHSFPLLWFGLYGVPREITLPPFPDTPKTPAPPWSPSVSPEEYAQAFTRIKRHIRMGDTYQVNLTYRLRRAFTEEPWPTFLRLATAHDAAYAAFITTRGWSVCSASPELFFSLDGTRLESRPMKGTAPRGLTHAQDRQNAAALQASEKDRAENLMVVDMVRNDLGRVAVTGSVEVPELFALEKYPTVWQLTSTVSAETHASVPEIFQALFPPASITGAPKPRTMELIAETETTPRNIYTGAIGFLAPGRRAQFNVAIRTLLVDHARNEAEYGVGGGIVWDSACAKEQAECRTKSHILSMDVPPFSLLESLLWTPADGYALLDKHLARLRDSAAYFDYALDPAALAPRLDRFARSLPDAPHKVRLLVAKDGAVTLEAEPIMPRPADAAPLRVALARQPVDPSALFLYHKTTNRGVYEEAVASRPGFDDVILFNAKSEVTESSRANVVAKINDVLCTPPVSCGLLPGTYRAHLLETGTVIERIITLDQFLHSPCVFLVNSVRGWMHVTVADEASKNTMHTPNKKRRAAPPVLDGGHPKSEENSPLPSTISK